MKFSNPWLGLQPHQPPHKRSWLLLQLVDTAVSKHSRERACFEKPWNRPYGPSVVVVVLEFDVSHGHRRAEYVAIANAAAREYGLPSYTAAPIVVHVQPPLQPIAQRLLGRRDSWGLLHQCICVGGWNCMTFTVIWWGVICSFWEVVRGNIDQVWYGWYLLGVLLL